jgi:DNA-binding phage protein
MKQQPAISDDQAVIRHLREDPEFAAEYLKTATDAEDPAVLKRALQRLEEADRRHEYPG